MKAHPERTANMTRRTLVLITIVTVGLALAAPAAATEDDDASSRTEKTAASRRKTVAAT